GVQQHRHHRTADEQLGQVHGATPEVADVVADVVADAAAAPAPLPLAPAPLAARSTTGAPGRRFCRPSTTTRSPGFTPVTTASVPAACTTAIGRATALPPSSTT